MANYVLKNSASCKDIFNKARKSYYTWFTDISDIEAHRLFSQFNIGDKTRTGKIIGEK